MFYQLDKQPTQPANDIRDSACLVQIAFRERCQRRKSQQNTQTAAHRQLFKAVRFPLMAELFYLSLQQAALNVSQQRRGSLSRFLPCGSWTNTCTLSESEFMCQVSGLHVQIRCSLFAISVPPLSCRVTEKAHPASLNHREKHSKGTIAATGKFPNVTIFFVD